MNNYLDELKKSKIFKNAGAYLAFSFIIIQLAEILFEPLGIDQAYILNLLLILVIIFPIVIVLTYFSSKQTSDDKSTKLNERNVFNFRLLFSILVLVLVFGLSISNILLYTSKVTDEWIENDLIPELVELSKKRQYSAALDLATSERLDGVNNKKLKETFTLFSFNANIELEQSEVEVYIKPNNDLDSKWKLVGLAPIKDKLMPRGFSRMKFEKAGFYSFENIVGFNYRGRLPKVKLLDKEPKNENEIFIAGGNYALTIPGLDHIEAVEISNYHIDKFEVKNLDYIKFINDSGYQNPSYWPNKFMVKGKLITREKAMKMMVDKSGMAGPSTWTGGQYPKGQDNYPVSGISWYEASAYAKYANKSLPTIYHWNVAANTAAAEQIIPYSNFSKVGSVRVGSLNGVTRYGVYDMAGNVREWCSNTISGNQKVILGGGFNDMNYSFQDIFGQDPFDRSETNGIRLVEYINGEPDKNSLDDIILQERDFVNEKLVTDEIFQSYLNNFKYDKIDLNPIIIMKDDTTFDLFNIEKIEFNAAYNGERMLAYLFLPKKKTNDSKYKTVVFFPGSNALYSTNSDNFPQNVNNSFYYNFLLKNGYALMLPIYKSTYERSDELKSDYPNESVSYKKHVIYWTNDFSASLDYLESREDIDTNNIFYYGISWGGFMANTILAVEKRINSAVLLVAGLCFQKSLPEVEAFQFTARINTPVIMLNGKYDHFFPYKTSQLPMFKLLKTPEKDKKYIVYEDGHTAPPSLLIKEAVNWLEKYSK
jgi:dienelactone hydrolase|tara:strand:+ start:248 stop:2542 length:2295 start_codon:yes stop_codon:yes gene_type:complete